VRTLRRARDEGLIATFVHSHPDGPRSFSPQDDRGEPLMAELARNRNGRNTPFLSLLTARDGQLTARLWSTDASPAALDLVRVVGERLRLHYKGRFGDETPKAFHRQALAFGPALNKDLAALRLGVVGCGATGSATAMLLGRLGARRLAAFDKDLVDESNLSRMHGATRADIGRPKVDVVKEYVEGFGLGAEVVTFQAWISDRACRDALKSCDVIFGCTDDHDGRLLLNRLAYFYHVPVIDMGIDIGLGPHSILGADVRVTTVMAGVRCLLCRNVIGPQEAYAEQLERSDPDEYRRRVNERYVRGGGNRSPAVVHFTTDAATMAIDELIHMLTAYRRAAASHRVRKFHLLADKRPGAVRNPDCPLCANEDYWGRGDVEPFLDRVG